MPTLSNLRKTYSSVIILSVFFIISGCGSSTKTAYYILTPSTYKHKDVTSSVFEGFIVLDHVELPRYLNRSKIVLQNTKNRLQSTDKHRWGEPLRENVARVLLVNLAALMGEEVVIGANDEKTGTRVAYRIEVKINRFVGTSMGDVYLDARVLLRDNRKGRRLELKKISIHKKSMEKNYEALVATQSIALADLAKAISELFEHLDLSSS